LHACYLFRLAFVDDATAYGDSDKTVFLAGGGEIVAVATPRRWRQKDRARCRRMLKIYSTASSFLTNWIGNYSDTI
jgi:hypothetical protein